MEIDTTNLDLHPATIDLSTFKHLLMLYDSTVQRVAAQKALKKPSSKGKSQTKDKKGKKRSAPSNDKDNEDEGNEDDNGGEGEVEVELTADQKNMVNDAVRQYRDLDDWRYGVLPGLLEERREMGEGEGEEDGEGKKKKKGKKSALCLSKDEAMKLLEWKLKHGLPRPSLFGLLRSNKENVIQSATRDAFASLPSATTNFPSLQQTLQKLTTPLRGVGPATASLILATADPEGVPFYSDDVYLWLCLGIYPGFDPSTPWLFNEDEEEEEKRAANPTPKPIQGKAKQEKNANDLRRPKNERDAAMRAKQVRPNGELNVKYDFPEYRRVWGAVRRLKERINEEAEENGEEGISSVDIEKVALVVRHLPGEKAELVVVKEVKREGGKVKKKEKEEKGVNGAKEEGEGQNGDKDEEGDFAGMNGERRKSLKRGGGTTR